MNKNSSESGVGVFGILGIVFVVLKLTDTIDWSWWYVTMPFWGGLAFALVLLVIAGVFSIACSLLARWLG